MKQKFDIIKSTCVPLPLENVDTDQIIPARFLKATDKEGFGENLFRDWRYEADGTPKDFVLNNPAYSGGKTAFGVAVWMVDYYAGKGTKLESILK